MKLTKPSKTSTKTIPAAMPPPSDIGSRPKPKPIAAAAIASGTCPNSAAARSPSSIAHAGVVGGQVREPAGRGRGRRAEPDDGAREQRGRELGGEHALATRLGDQRALDGAGGEVERRQPDPEDQRGHPRSPC